MRDDIYTIDEIRDSVVSALTNTAVVRAVLFGSYAKCEATESSDIDLLIDSNGELNGFNFYGVYHDLEKRFNKSVDLIEQMDLDNDSKLAKYIRKYGVVIYEQKEKCNRVFCL